MSTLYETSIRELFIDVDAKVLTSGTGSETLCAGTENKSHGINMAIKFITETAAAVFLPLSCVKQTIPAERGTGAN
jgi:hypothetical protein